MRESIGSAFLYNLVFIFLALIFSFLMGTLIYHKAFKVNTKIISSLEKFEGFNKFSKIEIENSLDSIGYPKGGKRRCLKRPGGSVELDTHKNYDYCVYLYQESGIDLVGTYYSYGVTTYISFDFPIIGSFLKLPIFTKSNRIYHFKES
ncbi:MAG: hypothetical protein RSB77_01580 [Bacilli bacterium]